MPEKHLENAKKKRGFNCTPGTPLFFSRKEGRRRAVAKTSMKTRRFFRGLSDTEISKVGFIFGADAGGDEKTRLFLEKRQKDLFLSRKTA